MKWEPLEQTRVTGIESVVLGKPELNSAKDAYIVPLGVRPTGWDKEVIVAMPIPLVERVDPADSAVTFKLYLEAALMTLQAWMTKNEGA